VNEILTQIVNTGGSLTGDIVRSANGVIMIVTSAVMWRATIGIRVGKEARRSLATIVGIMGVVLLLGGLKVIEGAAVPWIIHGLFPLLCAAMIWAGKVTTEGWRQLRRIVIDAEDRIN
jgi:hypothetical protein